MAMTEFKVKHDLAPSGLGCSCRPCGSWCARAAWTCTAPEWWPRRAGSWAIRRWWRGSRRRSPAGCTGEAGDERTLAQLRTDLAVDLLLGRRESAPPPASSPSRPRTGGAPGLDPGTGCRPTPPGRAAGRGRLRHLLRHRLCGAGRGVRPRPPGPCARQGHQHREPRAGLPRAPHRQARPGLGLLAGPDGSLAFTTTAGGMRHPVFKADQPVGDSWGAQEMWSSRSPTPSSATPCASSPTNAPGSPTPPPAAGAGAAGLGRLPRLLPRRHRRRHRRLGPRRRPPGAHTTPVLGQGITLTLALAADEPRRSTAPAWTTRAATTSTTTRTRHASAPTTSRFSYRLCWSMKPIPHLRLGRTSDYKTITPFRVTETSV